MNWDPPIEDTSERFDDPETPLERLDRLLGEALVDNGRLHAQIDQLLVELGRAEIRLKAAHRVVGALETVQAAIDADPRVAQVLGTAELYPEDEEDLVFEVHP